MDRRMFSVLARTGARLDRVLRLDLLAFVIGDILTTGIALSLGAIEGNFCPQVLMATTPMAWPAVMMLLVGVSAGTGLWLNNHFKNRIGILVWIVPVFIEAGAVLNNLGVIARLT